MNRLTRTILLTGVFASIAVGLEANEIRSVEHQSGGGETSPSSNSLLTLDAAIQKALELNPRLKAAGASVSAADERALQAGLWPNPELELEVENFGGNGELSGLDIAETTVVLSQPIPLGGKPGRRRAVAESVAQLVRWDLEAVRLDTIAGTTSAFVGVVAAQQRRELAARLLEVSQDFGRIVQARVDAGKVSPVEATRAQIEVSQARVALARAQRVLNGAKITLAATWGSGLIAFDRVVGSLPEPTTPPPITALRKLAADSPEMRRLEDEIERHEKMLAFEKALAIPDLSLGVGPRRFQESGDLAWVAGLSVSIPVFDRNQGARRAAEFEIEQIRRSADAARVEWETRLALVLEQVESASETARSIRSDIVPATASALAAVETGYREGKFGFIDVIAAQRSFFEASILLLDSLEEHAFAKTDLERLVGRSFDLVDEREIGSSTDSGEGQ